MTKYVVTGGTPLRGTIKLHGAKNVGFKVMIASLLGNSPSTIANLGAISEIEFASQAISAIGGAVSPLQDHCLTIDPAGLNLSTVPSEIGALSRASNLYAAPLLHRFGQATVPLPGGDQISRRPLERHFAGLEAMGCKVTVGAKEISFQAPQGLHGTTYRFPKNTHTGTEFLILAAAKADGTTILENAATEPEVDDLVKFLVATGAIISRTGERTIKVVGVKTLHGASHTVMADRNEAVTYACLALGTNGNVQIEQADAKTLGAFLTAVGEAGGQTKINESGIEFSYLAPLKATNVTAMWYPGFMTDWQPLWATLMTQAQGASTIHETVHEKRFDYVESLIKMGAKIEFFQPEVADREAIYNFNLADDLPGAMHAIRIFGPTHLSGHEVGANDVRSGATALMAGIIASGTTTITDVRDQIKRGYEDLAGGLVSLGAKIKIEV